jgi:molybdopterin-guanine dinucleotide biosynthesis protein A
VALIDPLAAALAGGTRRVTDFASGAGAVTVAFPDAHPPPFFNINTPADLAVAEAWIREH